MTTTASKKAFLSLIKALQATNQYNRRHDFAFRHSCEVTESTKELTDEECYSIIAELEKDYGYINEDSQCNQVRRKIIAMAHDMRWKTASGKADMKRIDNWCKSQGPYQKPLADHDLKELGILAGVFTKIFKGYMNKQ